MIKYLAQKSFSKAKAEPAEGGYELSRSLQGPPFGFLLQPLQNLLDIVLVAEWACCCRAKDHSVSRARVAAASRCLKTIFECSLLCILRSTVQSAMTSPYNTPQIFRMSWSVEGTVQLMLYRKCSIVFEHCWGFYVLVKA